MNKTNRIIDGTAILTTLICLCPIAFGIAMWNRLPETMAIHFDINGNPDNFGPKWVTVFLLPGIMAAMNIFTHVTFNLKAAKNETESKSKISTLFKWLFPIFSLTISFLGYSYNLGLGFDTIKITVIVISLTFIILGNYTPKMESWMLNIKVKEENLPKVKRTLGWSMVLCGLISLALSVTSIGAWALLVSSAVLFVTILVISFTANR